MMTFTLKLTCILTAPMETVWQKVSTMEGVNDELKPLLHMTAPQTAKHLPFTQAPVHQVFLSSWLLLFGWLPFDRHQLQFEQVWEGGFQENSSSWVHRWWRHERVIAMHDGGCTLTDTLQFEPRLPGLGYVLLPIVRFIFQHRHKRLKQWFYRGTDR